MMRAYISKISTAVWACLLMAVSSAVLMFGHEVVRSASSSLVKQAYGVENLPMIMACLPLILIPTLFIYNRILSYFGPQHTLWVTTAGSGAVILGCYFGILQGSALAAGFLFLWREAYIVLIAEQMWSFVNSVLSEGEAKKTSGLILFISTIGASSGGLFVNKLAMIWGTSHLLVVGALVCLPSAWLSYLSYQWVPNVKPKAKSKAKIDWMGIGLLRKERVLGVLFVMVALTQVYATVATLNFETQLTKFYPNVDEQTSVSGAYFALSNGLSLFFQSLASPIVLSILPVTMIHFLVPSIHLALILTSIIVPGFGPIAATFVAFKALDYSLFRSAKELLYMPLSFDARYRAKGLIDVLGYRMSKGATTIVILSATNFGVIFTQNLYCLIGIGSIFCWLTCVASLWAIKGINLRQSLTTSA